MSKKVYNTKGNRYIKELYKHFSDEMDKVVLPSADELVKMLDQYDGKERKGAPVIVPVVPLKPRRKVWHYAAAVLLLVGLGTAGWFYFGGQEGPLTASTTSDNGDSHSNVLPQREQQETLVADSNAVTLPDALDGTSNDNTFLAQNDDASNNERLYSRDHQHIESFDYDTQIKTDASINGNLADAAMTDTDTAMGMQDGKEATATVTPSNPVVSAGSDHRAVQPETDDNQALVPEDVENKTLNETRHYSDFTDPRQYFYQSSSYNDWMITFGAGVTAMAVVPEFWSGAHTINEKKLAHSSIAPSFKPVVSASITGCMDYGERFSIWPFLYAEINSQGWRAKFDSIPDNPAGCTYTIELKSVRIGAETGVDMEWLVRPRLGLTGGLGVGNYLGLMQRTRGERHLNATGQLMPGAENDWMKYNWDGIPSAVFCATGRLGLRYYFKNDSFLQLGLNYRVCSGDLTGNDKMYLPYSVFCLGYKERTLGMMLVYGISF